MQQMTGFSVSPMAGWGQWASLLYTGLLLGRVQPTSSRVTIMTCGFTADSLTHRLQGVSAMSSVPTSLGRLGPAARHFPDPWCLGVIYPFLS